MIQKLLNKVISLEYVNSNNPRLSFQCKEAALFLTSSKQLA